MATDMTSVRAAKKQLRAIMRHSLSQLSAESISKQSSVATGKLISTPEYQNAKRIGIYLSMPNGELSTGNVVHDAFEQGKQVFVPYIRKVEGPNSRRSVMDMVILHSMEDYERLKPDAWGIPSVPAATVHDRQQILNRELENPECNREPSSDAEGSSESRSMENGGLDMIVMPGVAFDRGLGRLGHGKGFYDYFLERYHHTKHGPMPSLVGLSLDIQLLPEGQYVPTDSSDYKLDALIIGNGETVRL